MKLFWEKAHPPSQEKLHLEKNSQFRLHVRHHQIYFRGNYIFKDANAFVCVGGGYHTPAWTSREGGALPYPQLKCLLMILGAWPLLKYKTQEWQYLLEAKHKKSQIDKCYKRKIEYSINYRNRELLLKNIYIFWSLPRNLVNCILVVHTRHDNF